METFKNLDDDNDTLEELVGEEFKSVDDDQNDRSIQHNITSSLIMKFSNVGHILNWGWGGL